LCGCNCFSVKRECTIEVSTGKITSSCLVNAEDDGDDGDGDGDDDGNDVSGLARRSLHTCRQ